MLIANSLLFLNLGQMEEKCLQAANIKIKWEVDHVKFQDFREQVMKNWEIIQLATNMCCTSKSFTDKHISISTFLFCLQLIK